jgi:small subunit ribosomal protein S20
MNRINRTRVKSAIRKIRTALAAGDVAAAEKLVGPTFSEVDRSIRKKVLSENTANRYKSRLVIAINSLRARKKA